MNIFNQELIDRTVGFLKKITKDDRVAVIHHTDPDGVCSGVLMCKLIERIREKQVDLRHNQPGSIHGFMNETLELLRNEKINIVITTDISPDDNYKNWKDVEEFAKILIVDHHPVRYEETENTIIIKPQLFTKDISPVRYCAAKLVYDIASKITDMSDLDWIASIGIIGDIASDAWGEFLQEVFKKYNFKKGKDWFDSPLGKCTSNISSTECYNENFVQKAFGIVYRAKSPEDITESELKEYQKIIKKEVNYWTSNVDNLAEIYPDTEVIYYEIKPKYKIKSLVSTFLGLNNPNKTVFVIDKEKEMVHISARRGDFKKNMGEILKKAVKDIPNSTAGGHIPAAGAMVPKESYDEFKKKLFEILKNE